LDETVAGPPSDEAPTREVPVLSEEQLSAPRELPPEDEPPVSVTDIVDDLLSPVDPVQDREGIQDATVVEGPAETQESPPLIEEPSPPFEASAPAPEPPAQPVLPPPWQDEPPSRAAQPPPYADPDPVEQVGRPASDPDLARAVRSKLAEQPGLLPGTVDLEVVSGVVILRGEARHPETIEELGRRSAAVPGVQEVRNMLRLPGGAPPPGDQAS